MKNNIRGIILAILTAAIMVAGVLIAAPSKADTTQDYQFYTLLQQDGWIITSPAKAKENGLEICAQLLSGRPWRLVLTDIMSQADLDLDAAASLMAISIVVYCPTADPRNHEDMGGKVA